MFRGIAKFFLSPVLLVLVVIAIEQLCFRFSEAYAMWKTDWIWKHNDSVGKMAGVFSLLPLSQLAEPPAGDLNSFSGGIVLMYGVFLEKTRSDPCL